MRLTCTHTSVNFAFASPPVTRWPSRAPLHRRRPEPLTGLIGYQALSHPQTPDERLRSANNPRQGVNTDNAIIVYQDRGDTTSGNTEAETIPADS
ncbi:hypothetical protein QTP88_006289 [Uroleucon formosanum]